MNGSTESKSARRRPSEGHLPPTGLVHHYLVVANQTLCGEALHEAIAERVRLGPSRFHVLVPATPARDLYQNMLHALEGEPPDEDQAVDDARTRLAFAVESIRGTGATADGEIGDADPLTAIEEVLAVRHFDEIIVSTLPAPVSHWLRLDLPAKVTHAFDLPVVHVTAGLLDPD